MTRTFYPLILWIVFLAVLLAAAMFVTSMVELLPIMETLRG